MTFLSRLHHLKVTLHRPDTRRRHRRCTSLVLEVEIPEVPQGTYLSSSCSRFICPSSVIERLQTFSFCALKDKTLSCFGKNPRVCKILETFSCPWGLAFFTKICAQLEIFCSVNRTSVSFTVCGVRLPVSLCEPCLKPNSWGQICLPKRVVCLWSGIHEVINLNLPY